MIFYISQEKPKHFKEIEKDFLKLLKIKTIARFCNFSLRNKQLQKC